MKYILIILLSFVFISPALAAKSVSGTVPKVTPLQPAPVGVFPNLKNNVQFHDPSHSLNQPGNGGNEIATGTQAAPVQSQTVQNSAVPKSGKTGYVIWTLLILVLLGVAWLVFKNKKPNDDV